MTLEQKIKDFLSDKGVKVAGVAGPERFDGPPSLDPAYTLRGAKSIVSMALPMEASAIYDFLGKKSPVPHNLDQLKKAQRLYRISKELADYLTSLGHRAREVPINNSYRRKVDVFSPLPSFSHRFGAIVSGIAGQGLSGNVMTEEYGAAVCLSTVVTDAVLTSDPVPPAGHYLRERCAECGICAKTCASRMFVDSEMEYVLLNGELHARGKRRNLDLCNATCFGLHAISYDHQWSTWGRFWIRRWVDGEQDPAEKKRIRNDQLWRGATTGDSAPRYEFIRRMFSMLWPKQDIEDRIPEVEDLPQDNAELEKMLYDFQEKMGVTGIRGDPNTLTCGQCALICGPSLEETRRRYETLLRGGIVAPGPDGGMVRVKDFDEAVEYKKKYRSPVTKAQMIQDSKTSKALWTRLYFGFEPLPALKGWLYARRLRRAVKKKEED